MSENYRAVHRFAELPQITPRPIQILGVPLLPFLGVLDSAANDVDSDEKHVSPHERKLLSTFQLSGNGETVRPVAIKSHEVLLPELPSLRRVAVVPLVVAGDDKDREPRFGEHTRDLLVKRLITRRRARLNVANMDHELRVF